jgi:hypothetical protein
LAADAEDQLRAHEMLLCDKDATGAGWLYKLGGASKYYYRWSSVSKEQREKRRQEIIETAKVSHSAARARGGATGLVTGGGNPAVTAASSLSLYFTVNTVKYPLQ